MEISKRDYFAAQALTGLLSRTGGPTVGLAVHANVAAEAFHYADEMLKLSKTLMDPVEIDPDEFARSQTPVKKAEKP